MLSDVGRVGGVASVLDVQSLFFFCLLKDIGFAP